VAGVRKINPTGPREGVARPIITWARFLECKMGFAAVALKIMIKIWAEPFFLLPTAHCLLGGGVAQKSKKTKIEEGRF